MLLGTLLAYFILTVSHLAGAIPTTHDHVKIETRTIDEIYQDALKEEGVLRVAWGGDIKVSQKIIVDAFTRRFPDIPLDLGVGLSKYHSPLIDRYWENSNFTDDGADVAVLQTLHDFPRWKSEGRLLNYKVSSWDDIYPEFIDSDGAYTGLYIFTFGNIIYKENSVDLPIPQTFPEFIHPRFSSGQITSAYPNDDDAVLYLFSRIVQTHGWDFMHNFSKQNITWIRGTASPGMLIAQEAGPTISFATSSVFASGLTITTHKDVFMSWPQTGTIFKSTKMPETAKLFLSYLMHDEWQQGITSGGYATRKTYDRLGVFKQEPQMHPLGYVNFMSDRRVVEWWRFQFEEILGPPQGRDPNLMDW
ncbi:hypothetical protein CPB83DRAFT_813428 [Crepidotus variabilis]|uniref:Periplasmic binding protein-like II n=1 Tax=Crepidotus variabilis TaxID=179855 RepID=A0A9P6JPT6_9AGAR|nr:hypothetical protein CPB83DRAFT_813428 [Crepidotus variabilis]